MFDPLSGHLGPTQLIPPYPRIVLNALLSPWPGRYAYVSPQVCRSQVSHLGWALNSPVDVLVLCWGTATATLSRGQDADPESKCLSVQAEVCILHAGAQSVSLLWGWG